MGYIYEAKQKDDDRYTHPSIFPIRSPMGPAAFCTVWNAFPACFDAELYAFWAVFCAWSKEEGDDEGEDEDGDEDAKRD